MYRAYQAQQSLGGKIIFPQVMQLKPGPLLRGEKDARSYGNIFRHRTFDELALHAKALCLLALHHHSDLQIYEGLGNHFKDLDPQYQSGFCTYLTQRYKHPASLQQTLQRIRTQDICIHIRRGDFASASSPMAAMGTMNFLTEDEWYIRATEMAREFHPNGRVRLFTDSAQLPATLLDALKPDEIDHSPDAFHALMKMAAHGMIVTSRSSFSLWAAYLGQSRAIVCRDFDLARYMRPNAIDAVRC